MTINAIIYARTSADCAVPAEEQVKVLRAVAVAQGWIVSKVFCDRPMPPKRGREQRPGEVALLSAIRSGGLDRVLLWSLDRVGRSLSELVTLLETCRTAGAELYLHDHGIDTGTSNGLELFDLSKMLAHHLRQSRRGRILRGQAAARGANVKFGRPPIAMTKVEKVRRELANGRGVREAARVAGISAASASRIKNSMPCQSATA
jgi:DNA invertase Pin-like site-specific DNA recombinase